MLCQFTPFRLLGRAPSEVARSRGGAVLQEPFDTFHDERVGIFFFFEGGRVGFMLRTKVEDEVEDAKNKKNRKRKRKACLITDCMYHLENAIQNTNIGETCP